MTYTAVKINRHKDKIVSYILKSETGTLKVSAQELKGLIQAGMKVSNLTLTSDGRLVRKKSTQTGSQKQAEKKPNPSWFQKQTEKKSETNTKYTLLRQFDKSITVNGRQLYRIRANTNFGDVKKGDIGGYIESVDNLSTSGTCWVYDNAKVMSDAVVSNNAKIQDSAVICDYAKITGNAVVKDHAKVEYFGKVMDNAIIRGNGKVCGWGEVCDNAIVEDDAQIKQWAKVNGSARVSDRATIDDWATVKDNAVIRGNAAITKYAQVHGNAQVSGNVEVSDYAHIYDKVKLDGNTKVADWDHVRYTTPGSSAKLGDLGEGELFYDEKGNQYVVLEHLDNTTAVLSCSPMGHKVAYDTKGGQDFNSSTLKTELEKLVVMLEKDSFPQGALKGFMQALTPVDYSTNEETWTSTKTCKGKLSLLTYFQYREFSYLIPEILEDWWLLTPVVSKPSAFDFLMSTSTVRFSKQRNVLCVGRQRMSKDKVYSAPTTEEKALRPMMVLDSAIIVRLGADANK